jgi:hypothetical protein
MTIEGVMETTNSGLTWAASGEARPTISTRSAVAVLTDRGMYLLPGLFNRPALVFNLYRN